MTSVDAWRSLMGREDPRTSSSFHLSEVYPNSHQPRRFHLSSLHHHSRYLPTDKTFDLLPSSRVYWKERWLNCCMSWKTNGSSPQSQDASRSFCLKERREERKRGGERKQEAPWHPEARGKLQLRLQRYWILVFLLKPCYILYMYYFTTTSIYYYYIFLYIYIYIYIFSSVYWLCHPSMDIDK